MTSRDQHLEWCKDRAMVYIDDHDLINAMASFASDLRKHPETMDVGIATDYLLAALGTMYVMNNDVHGMRQLIQGVR